MEINKMSRREVFNLADVIDAYKESKDKENKLKKVNDEMNTNIKNYMSLHNMQTASSEKYTATVSITDKSTLNDNIALDIIKRELSDKPDLLNSVIKTKEYIDEDALEKLVYNKQFDITTLDSAITTKKVSTLRITKIRNKED